MEEEEGSKREEREVEIDAIVVAIEQTSHQKKRLTLVLDRTCFDDRLVDEVLFGRLPRGFDLGKLGHDDFEREREREKRVRD